MAAVNHKDTYKASAVFLIVMGMLYLIDKFIGFASHGLPHCRLLSELFSSSGRN